MSHFPSVGCWSLNGKVKDGTRRPLSSCEDLNVVVLLAEPIRESYMEEWDLKILASLSFVHYFLPMIGPRGKERESRRLKDLHSSNR